jgi:hypothetical protein
MNCPIDGTELLMMERQGVEIDFCPRCRGVWLDRGELDKILERSGGRVQPPAQEREHWSREDDVEYRPYRDDDASHQRKRRREGFLGDLFDFGG